MARVSTAGLACPLRVPARNTHHHVNRQVYVHLNSFAFGCISTLSRIAFLFFSFPAVSFASFSCGFFQVTGFPFLQGMQSTEAPGSSLSISRSWCAYASPSAPLILPGSFLLFLPLNAASLLHRLSRVFSSHDQQPCISIKTLFFLLFVLFDPKASCQHFPGIDLLPVSGLLRLSLSLRYSLQPRVQLLRSSFLLLSVSASPIREVSCLSLSGVFAETRCGRRQISRAELFPLSLT